MMGFNDNRKIGVFLTGLGALFMFLGVLLLFDRGMLSLGNLLFLLGITLLIGAKKTVIFFSRPGKRRGTACLVIGILMVLVNWCFLGMLIEMFGILNLFGNFFPIVLGLLRGLPVVGPVLNWPPLARLLDRFIGSVSVLPTHISNESPD